VCFERFGLRRTTIDDVAKEAKVSRSTVYRYFDGRGDLIVAALMRESDAVHERVKTLMRAPGPFPERVVKATLKSIDAIKSGKYLPIMLTPEGAILTSRAVTASSAFYEASRDTMRPFFEEAQASGEIRKDITLDDFLEWSLRIIFSFAMFDSPTQRDPKKSVRRLIETFLVPSIT
jgi:AcrR family transcriptional regulator